MKARCCTTALLNLVEDLRLELNENSVAILVLLDHSKAFDTVNHKILLNKLRKMLNFSNIVRNLIISYPLSKCQKVHLNGNSRGINTGASVVLYVY